MVTLQHWRELSVEQVDSDGNVIGLWDSNPILNTLVYECELNDGMIKEYLPMSLLPTFMRKVMQMDFLLQCPIRLLIISLQGRLSS